MACFFQALPESPWQNLIRCILATISIYWFQIWNDGAR